MKIKSPFKALHNNTCQIETQAQGKLGADRSPYLEAQTEIASLERHELDAVLTYTAVIKQMTPEEMQKLYTLPIKEALACLEQKANQLDPK